MLENFAASELPASEHQVGGADADRKFARLAIEEARKSISEDDNRPHPKVRAVVVKDHKVLSTAFRGERPENHAEYIALEEKLADEAAARATCTQRWSPARLAITLKFRAPTDWSNVGFLVLSSECSIPTTESVGKEYEN